jgi:ComEC/Rec2-related protein
MKPATIQRSVRSVSGRFGKAFPGLRRWFHLPGFVGWCGATLGVALALELPFRFAIMQEPFATVKTALLYGAVAAFAAAGVLLRPRIVRFVAFVLFAVMITLCHRAHQAETFDALRNSMGEGERMTMTGKVSSAPMPYLDGFHFRLRIESVEGTASPKITGITVDCSCPENPPHFGRVTVRGRLQLPAPRRNPFEYDEYAAMMANGVWGRFEASSCDVLACDRSLPERIDHWFRSIATAVLDKVDDFDNRALLQASFLGDTEYLSPAIKEVFRASGTYHLIAISGLNTAMLTIALYFFLGLFRLRKIVKHLLCIAALWAYLPFVGIQPSLFRATIMATLVIAALLFEKKNYALHTLGLAGIVWLALSPESLCGPGFQLSFAATTGLLTLFPVLYRFRPTPDRPLVRRGSDFLFSSLYVSVTSFLATAPILLYHFGTLSFFGLVANLVAVAAMTVAMWAFFAALFCQMVIPFAAALPLWCSERFMDIVVGTAKWSTRLPWSRATFPAPSSAAILLFTIFLIGLATVKIDRIKTYLVSCAVAAMLIIPALSLLHRPSGLTAVHFRIPKSEAIGIQWPDDRLWLFYSGNTGALQRNFERHISPWVRHTGNRRIERLFVPEATAPTADSAAAACPALAGTRILGFPSVIFAPAGSHPPDTAIVWSPQGTQSAVSLIPQPNGNALRLTAYTFETALPFEHRQVSASRRASQDDPVDDPENPGAQIVSLKPSGIEAASIVPLDHPVR